MTKTNGKLDVIDIAFEAGNLLKYLKEERELSPQQIMAICQSVNSIMTHTLSTESIMVSIANMLGYNK